MFLTAQLTLPGISLVQAMAWQQTSDNPLPESLMTRFLLLYVSLALNELTHHGLVMPNDNTDLGQHWLR